MPARAARDAIAMGAMKAGWMPAPNARLTTLVTWRPFSSRVRRTVLPGASAVASTMITAGTAASSTHSTRLRPQSVSPGPDRGPELVAHAARAAAAGGARGPGG